MNSAHTAHHLISKTSLFWQPI